MLNVSSDKSFCVFASNKNQSFLEMKPHCSEAYGTVVLCLLSKLTGKLENFSNQQLPKNDIFLMSFSAWVMMPFSQTS